MKSFFFFPKKDIQKALFFFFFSPKKAQLQVQCGGMNLKPVSNSDTVFECGEGSLCL